MLVKSIANYLEIVHKLGNIFESRAIEYDNSDSFVEQNYNDLKENGFFSAIIPQELGGSGISFSDMCNLLRELAQYCGSTALALSMHQHLLSANVWKYKHGQGMEAMLKNVAANQPVLVSTGANDWLESSGVMVKTNDGFLVTAVKHFASQSAVGDVLVTSAAYDDPELGWQVLHFSVPFKSSGITVLNNWEALGMRATGSHSVKLEKVFIPDAAISLRRPKGEFHPVWNVILTVAMPLIMSVYLGIAQKAERFAITHISNQKTHKPYVPDMIGDMRNELTTAELNVKDMIRIANNFDFKPLDKNGNDILIRKTNAAKACINVVEKAMNIVGGPGFYRSFGLEKLFRDVQAAKYHPLQEKDQLRFTGEFILRTAKDPVALGSAA